MLSILSFLNLISISLSLAFQILIVRFFGAYLETDVYYLLIAIVQFLNIFTGIILDLYIPFYNDIKAKEQKKANEFVGSMYSFIFIISSFFSILIFLFPHIFIKIFASGFNREKILFASSLLKILSISLIFNFINLLIDFTLKANFYLTFSFFMQIFPPLFNLFSLIFFSKIYGIKAIIYAMVFSSFFNFLFYNFYLFKKNKIKFKSFIKFKKEIFLLVRQNIILKSGGIIWNLTSPITTNVLSYFPTGHLTLFVYSNRIISLLSDTINSPIFQVFYIKISKYLSEENIQKIKDLSNEIVKVSLILFIIPLFFILLIFKKLFLFLFYPKLGIEEINKMYLIFLSLIPYYIILCFESTFKNITICMKRVFKVLEIAIVYIIFYSLLIISTIKYMGIYALPFSLFFSQIYNTLSYYFYVDSKLKIMEKSVLKDVFELFLFVFIFLLLNLFFESKDGFRLFFNFLLALLFYFKKRKDILNSLSFLMQRIR